MKRLVLGGGGHAHVEVLRRFAALPPAGVELVLVSPGAATAYSGMMPGVVAGFYARRDLMIDLALLASRCGARFLRARIASVDAAARSVALDDGTRLAYDALSLDVGSTPGTGGAQGVAAHALRVKPIVSFLDAWDALLARAERGGVRRLALVGGGAAGIEILLSMQHRLRADAGADVPECHLVTDAPELLPGHDARVRAIFDGVFAARGVRVHAAAPVVRVEPGRLLAANGLALDADAIVWATGASPPALAVSSGLALDAAGYVAIGETLQSSSHAEVFAAGDMASMVGHPRPRSGVYAVRQGPPLAANLRAFLAGRPLVRYVPQRRALALITTGDRHAVASRGKLTLQGRWVWRWKDWIDRRFVARYV
jgi:selenide,water dikinase